MSRKVKFRLIALQFKKNENVEKNCREPETG